jgi:uncharacterized protein YjbI with pentapeptide repeats
MKSPKRPARPRASLREIRHSRPKGKYRRGVAKRAVPDRMQRVTVATAIIAAVGALVYNGLTLNATRAQLRITEQGQVTDRYAKAIEQLGSTGSAKLDIRLGGIFALERIASDSARDEPTVLEVLASFVREHSREPVSPAEMSVPAYPGEPAPRLDIQAALTVIGHFPHKSKNGPDLRGAYIPGADLTEAHLEHARLEQTILTGADLTRAKVEQAFIVNANLKNASLTQIDLTGAFLDHSDLTAASMGGAILSGTYFFGVNMGGAFLANVSARNVVLQNARLNCAPNVKNALPICADLRDADLRGADLSGADLSGANLRGAHLNDAFVTCEAVARKQIGITGCIKDYANFRGADLTGADLRGADLRGADLRGARVTKDQISKAITNSATRL